MSYDPCGTQHLEGDEIIKRLAKYLEVEIVDLEAALKHAALLNKTFRGTDKK